MVRGKNMKSERIGAVIAGLLCLASVAYTQGYADPSGTGFSPELQKQIDALVEQGKTDLEAQAAKDVAGRRAAAQAAAMPNPEAKSTIQTAPGCEITNALDRFKPHRELRAN